MRISFSVLASIIFLSLLATGCSRFSRVLKSKDMEYKLKMADKYYVEKKYRFAQELYEELYPVYKGTDKFEEIYFKDAYCFYYQENFRDAENFFKGFLEVFPNSTKAEEVDFMHAYCFYKQSPKVELDQSNTTKAIGMMQTFINTHPGSSRIQAATEVIDKCRAKLEMKALRAAELYYKVGQYRAAALAYEDLLNTYPESFKGDEYKYRIVKSYYMFAKLSVVEKQIERYEKVITEYDDFLDRYPDSKLLKEALVYKNLSLNNIKEIQNEQTQTSTQL